MFPNGLRQRVDAKADGARFAFRIEIDRVLLAIGEASEDQTIVVRFDCVRLEDFDVGSSVASEGINAADRQAGSDDGSPAESEGEQSPQQLEPLESENLASDWLLGDGWQKLRRAIETLAKRHHIGRSAVAVSLSGDFCVTRISTGSSDDVDRELQSLAGRIPRYLQLGPGGKLTGQIRECVSPGVEHALTAVGNFNRLSGLYDAFNASDVEIAWIEPSLVSMARLAGWFGLDRDHPVLIADSFGQSWEVGITHQGRLLLDYRPAAALDAQTFASAIEEHTDRLRRFCLRHRGMTQSQLDRLYVGGPPEKVDVVLDYFGPGHDLRAHAFAVPPAILDVRAEGIDPSDAIAGVAALVPMIAPETPQTPPDLLQSIRRQRDRSRLARNVLTWWPAATAAVILVSLTLWNVSLRRQSEQKQQQRDYVESEMRATRVRMAALQSDRRWVEYLQSIQNRTTPAPVADLVESISHCLPPRTFLKSIRLESGREFRLVGVTSNEAEVYEIVGYLRRLPGMDQVALLGTSSGANEEESQFELRLSWSDPKAVVKPTSATQEYSE